MKLGDIGELALLAELESRGLVRGIEHDAAAIDGLVITQDALIEGVHIRFEPEAWVYHYHDYTAEAFCSRQRIAGEMAVVFVRLHPELGDLFGTWPTSSSSTRG